MLSSAIFFDLMFSTKVVVKSLIHDDDIITWYSVIFKGLIIKHSYLHTYNKALDKIYSSQL